MVHNGIEYGIMASYAEGLNILRNATLAKRGARSDAETAPLEHPEYYRYDIDIAVGCRGLAPGQRDRLVAARSHRRRPCSSHLT